MIEHTLISGRTLKIPKLPFKEREDYICSILSETGTLNFSATDEIEIELLKGVLCRLFTSTKVKFSFNKILKKCLIDDVRVTEEVKDEDSFMEDYLEIFVEVSIKVVSPFLSKTHSVFQKAATSLGLTEEDTPTS